MNSYSIQNDFISISVKTKGAEMSSLKSIKTGKEYLWQANPEYWGRHAPVLFPIVGQVQNSCYKVGDREFELSQHGFARDTEFDLISQSETRLVFGVKSNEATLAKYPYEFELQLSYEIVDAEVKVGYKVVNTDSQKIWFSIGAHPAFNCPQKEGQVFSDFILEFEQKETIGRLNFAKGLLSGTSSPFFENQNVIQLGYDQFDEDAIIFENMKSRYVDLKTEKDSEFMRFHYNGFPFFAIWSPPGKNAPFVCLEPWYGITDTLDANLDYREKKGIQSLDLAEEFNSEYSMELIDS